MKLKFVSALGRMAWSGGMALAVGSLCGATAFAASTGPHLEIQHQTNGEPSVVFDAPAGVYCRIEAAADLLRWDSLATFRSTGSVQHTDAAAPYLRSRYYRGLQLDGTNHLTGDHLNTDVGDVVIHPIRHATFVMQWSDQMIYVDPVGEATPFQGLPRATLILVTHDHSDHFHSATLDAVRGPGVMIFAPQAVYSSMSTTLRALTTVLTNGASTTVAGLSIAAMAAYNFTAAYHPRGRGNGYVLTIAGRRIYISGDTEDTPEMRALEDIDVAFLAMNKPYTMNVDQAASAAREFQPRVVYPYHYSQTPPTDLNAFKQRVGQDLGIEVRLRNWY